MRSIGAVAVPVFFLVFITCADRVILVVQSVMC